MTQCYSAIKIFAFCRKDGVCLKFGITIFVCSLLCFTCLMIESRRSDPNIRLSRSSKQDAQKLIQIKTKPQSVHVTNEIMEESSGYYMENNNLNPVFLIEENTTDNSLNNDDLNRVINTSHEMLASSNFISKSNGVASSSQGVTVTLVDDYDYKDLVDDVEKLLEYPVFSETQAQDVFADCDQLQEFKVSIDHDDQRGDKEKDIFWSEGEQNSDENFQLSPVVEKTDISNLDSDDRFFPDEYAFQIEQSAELPSYEIIHGNQRHKNFHRRVTHEFPINNVDIPTIIDSFLGRISTLLVPTVKNTRPLQDNSYLANFRENKYSEEGMKLASSKVNRIWREKPSHTKDPHAKINRPKPPIRKDPNAFSKVRSSHNGNNHQNLLQQLFGINRNL